MERMISCKSEALKNVAIKPQLFLLHFAGGSRFSFDFLREHIEPHFEFIPLEMPGRGRRTNEKLLRTKAEVVQDYFNQIRVSRNKQHYLIYGHSMGAILGLHIAKQLEESGDPPAYLVVSGNPGPGIPETDEGGKRVRRYLMNDHDLKEALRELGGVPKEVLENAELYDFFSPIMRTDFEVLEKDTLADNIQVRVPIYALMGADEKGSCNIDSWRRFTSDNFTSEIMPGKHFFIRDQPERLADVMMRCYRAVRGVERSKNCLACDCKCARALDEVSGSQ